MKTVRRVLVATDGSSDALRAIRWLNEVPFAAGAALGVLSVATLTDPPRTSQSMAELRAKVRAAARRAADRAATILRDRWPRVETVVAEGDPRVEIVRAVEDTRADLLVLGARGLGRLRGLLVGSTSLAAVRYAPCPVVVVRGRPRPPRHILIGVDGSPGSRAAVRLVRDLTLARGARITLVHVLAQPDDGDDDRKKADRILADAAAPLADAPKRIDRVAVGGDVARGIVATARSRDADLVVLGARRLHALGRLLLGSVSEAVLHHAGRPVLIARTRER